MNIQAGLWRYRRILHQSSHYILLSMIWDESQIRVHSLKFWIVLGSENRFFDIFPFKPERGEFIFFVYWFYVKWLRMGIIIIILYNRSTSEWIFKLDYGAIEEFCINLVTISCFPWFEMNLKYEFILWNFE